MGRPSRGRMEKVFTLAVSEAELAELHRRAAAAGFKTTADWVRSRLLRPEAEAPPPGGSSP